MFYLVDKKKVTLQVIETLRLFVVYSYCLFQMKLL